MRRKLRRVELKGVRRALGAIGIIAAIDDAISAQKRADNVSYDVMRPGGSKPIQNQSVQVSMADTKELEEEWRHQKRTKMSL